MCEPTDGERATGLESALRSVYHAYDVEPEVIKLIAKDALDHYSKPQPQFLYDEATGKLERI